MIETLIQKLIDALTANTEALKNAGTAPVVVHTTPAPETEKEKKAAAKEEKKAAKDAAKEEKKSTVDQASLKAVGTKLIQEGRAKEVKEVLTSFGAERLSSLKEGDYEAVMAKFTALAEKPKEEDLL